MMFDVLCIWKEVRFYSIERFLSNDETCNTWTCDLDNLGLSILFYPFTICKRTSLKVYLSKQNTANHPIFVFCSLIDKTANLPPFSLSPRKTTKGKQPETPDTFASTVTMKSNKSSMSMSPTVLIGTSAKRSLENYDEMDHNEDEKKKSAKLEFSKVPWTNYDSLASYLIKVHPDDAKLLSELSHVDLVEYCCADYSPSELKMLMVYFAVSRGIPLENMKTDGQSKKNLTLQIVDILTSQYNESTGETMK